jgi:hypothetical protein
VGLSSIGIAAGIVGASFLWSRRERTSQPLRGGNNPHSTGSNQAEPIPTVSKEDWPTTKEGLYELAKQRKIPGRSKMDKAELEAALSESQK